MEQIEIYKVIEDHYRSNFTQLVRRFSRFLNSKARAEDIVQEAYTRALTYWKSLSPDISVNAWLRTILNNCIKDNFKTEMLHGMANYSETETISKPNAIPAIMLKQVVERIKAKPENIGRILSLFLLEQYRPIEIAQVVTEKVSNIRQIVSRFRKEIRKEFKWKI